MLVGRGVAQDVNNLFSDLNTFRNEDYVSNQGLTYSKGEGVGAVGAQYSHVQILNPSGSGVVVLLDRLQVRCTGGEFVRVNQYDTPLPTAANYWLARKLGDPGGNAEIRVSTNGSVLGSGIDNYGISTTAPITVADKFPIILEEGRGLVIVSSIVNVNLYVSFVGREV